MTYEPNVWYGWNGGECPVHPEDMVECAFIADPAQRSCTAKAKDIYWSASPTVGVQWYKPDDNLLASTPVGPVAFRIIKEYKEPRDFWVSGFHCFESLDHAKRFQRDSGDTSEEIIHVREVIA